MRRGTERNREEERLSEKRNRLEERDDERGD